MKYYYKLLCFLGIHGPNWYGNEWGRWVSFVRRCPHCGEMWYGEQVYTEHYRTIGNWMTEQQLRSTGEWNDS